MGFTGDSVSPLGKFLIVESFNKIGIPRGYLPLTSQGKSRFPDPCASVLDHQRDKHMLRLGQKTFPLGTLRLEGVSRMGRHLGLRTSSLLSWATGCDLLSHHQSSFGFCPKSLISAF